MEQELLKKKFKELEDFVGTDDTTGEVNKLSVLASKRETHLNSFVLLSSVKPIIGTALVINWEFTKLAKPRIDRFMELFPEIDSIKKLYSVILGTDPKLFLTKYLNINSDRPERNPKYVLLKTLCEAFLEYQKEIKINNEIKLLKYWATHVDLERLKDDPIGKYKGIGIGTIQNIILSMGIPAVKPDRHVINSIKNYFGITIKTSEYPKVARLLGVSDFYFDKVLFEYSRNIAKTNKGQKTNHKCDND